MTFLEPALNIAKRESLLYTKQLIDPLLPVSLPSWILDGSRMERHPQRKKIYIFPHAPLSPKKTLAKKDHNKKGKKKTCCSSTRKVKKKGRMHLSCPEGSNDIIDSCRTDIINIPQPCSCRCCCCCTRFSPGSPGLFLEVSTIPLAGY